MAKTPAAGTPAAAGAPAPTGPRPAPERLRRAYRVGYGHGSRGDEGPRPMWDDAELQDAYTRGRADAADANAAPVEEEETDGQAAPAGRSPGRSRRPASSSSSGPGPIDRAARSASRSFPLPIASDGGGFILGLLLYALGYNFLAGGAAQARGWLAAKFLNRPYTGQPTEGTKAATQPGTGVGSGGGGGGQSTSSGAGTGTSSGVGSSSGGSW